MFWHFCGKLDRWPRNGVGEDYGVYFVGGTSVLGRYKCGGSWDLGSTLQRNILHFFTHYGVP